MIKCSTCHASYAMDVSLFNRETNMGQFNEESSYRNNAFVGMHRPLIRTLIETGHVDDVAIM